MKFHSLRRTSPMSEDFLGTCVHCNKENLSFKDMNTECEFAKEDDFENDLLKTLDENKMLSLEELTLSIAIKIYNKRPYGYNDVPPSCETEYIKWENISDQIKYINLAKDIVEDCGCYFFDIQLEEN